MTLSAPAPTSVRFDLLGEVVPLAKAVQSNAYRPTRPLGGWLATYGHIGPNGGVVPTEDRQRHVFEAASALGRIDFSEYRTKGLWNDTHQGYPGSGLEHLPRVHVGVPTGLEFHDEFTALAKAHRKVGFWTEGHLFDRADPRSWTLFTSYQPTEADLNRADHFWNLSTLLKGIPRPLGFSAQGKMLLSPCGKRIIWAKITGNAVCEMPQNPDSIAIPLNLAVPITRSMVDASPCESCRCPPGARCPVLPLAKGRAAEIDDTGTVTPQHGGGVPVGEDLEPVPSTEAIDELVRLVCATQKCDARTARRWVTSYFARNRGSAADQPGSSR